MADAAYEQWKASILGQGAPPAPMQDIAQPQQAPAISAADSAIAGASQGVSMGFGDEIAALASSLGINPKVLAASIAANPVIAANYAAMRGGKELIDKGAVAVVDKYRSDRAANRAYLSKAEADNKKSYIGGQIGGGILGAALLPGGVPATLGRAIATGAAYGGAAGLGGSDADITQGEVGKAALDTGAGAVVGGVAGAAGHGATMAIEGARRLVASLGESKMVGTLTQYLKNITERNGTPAAQKAVAGKLMNAAREAAGDVPLGVERFLSAADDLVAKATSPGTGGLSPEAKLLSDAAAEIRSAGGTLTLKQLDNNLQAWSGRIKDWANDPAKQRVAKLAARALGEDLDAAVGNTGLGEAAKMLADARAAYGSGARAADLQAILTKSTDSLSEGGSLISPRKFASLNSGANKAKVDRLLAGDEGAKEAWESGVELARTMAKKGDTWMPKTLQDLLPPKAIKAFDSLTSYRNISKVFSSTEDARDFARLLSPDLGKNSQEAIALISRIAGRIGDESADLGVKLQRVAGYEDKPTPQDESMRAAR